MADDMDNTFDEITKDLREEFDSVFEANIEDEEGDSEVAGSTGFQIQNLIAMSSLLSAVNHIITQVASGLLDHEEGILLPDLFFEKATELETAAENLYGIFEMDEYVEFSIGPSDDEEEDNDEDNPESPRPDQG